MKLLEIFKPRTLGFRTVKMAQRSLTPGYQRKEILADTLELFETRGDELRETAMNNLVRWKEVAKFTMPKETIVNVLPGDWGDVTMQMTMKYGEMFAALNMANAYVFGGGYLGGSAAQEENMFRRTDCHFTIPETGSSYTPEMTQLLNGDHGYVYLDVENPRICIKGSENVGGSSENFGYELLPREEIFPFIELRAAALDLRGRHAEVPSDPEPIMRKRIKAQFRTLKEKGVRYVVLGAFGCGAFRNNARMVARLYKEEIEKTGNYFKVITFAIFHAGYGPNNYKPFAEIFKD